MDRGAALDAGPAAGWTASPKPQERSFHACNTCVSRLPERPGQIWTVGPPHSCPSLSPSLNCRGWKPEKARSPVWFPCHQWAALKCGLEGVRRERPSPPSEAVSPHRGRHRTANPQGTDGRRQRGPQTGAASLGPHVAHVPER